MNTNRSGNLHEVMRQAAWDSATVVPEGDLTINQKRTATWDMWSGNHTGHIEEVLHEMTKKEKP